jgi:glycine cleavage system transcriptional repressor
MRLVITLAGENRPELIMELTRLVKECKCTIMESRMTELENDFAAHMMVEANWNHIVKLEDSLEAFGNRYLLKIQHLRGRESSANEEEPAAIPYSVDIVASDQLENIHELAEFFFNRNIRVIDVSTSRYPAPFSASPLFLAHLIVIIPSQLKIVSLRDDFLEFCDQQNLDAILEPIKR